MKYYIPTSNLNLDNILQSECILPISHYAQRCSGYKNFEQIEESRSTAGIVLFNHPVVFSINDPGRYNYPILIEFEDDYQAQDFVKSEVQEGVFFSNHRINLTPLNCRIYFFSEKAYNLTIINTRSNKAIKYFKEYKIQPFASTLSLVQMPKLNESIHIEISKFEDSVIDKQKGLLYAFLLGQEESVNHDLAVQLRLNQELYNILTNLISSPSNKSVFGVKLSSLLDDYKKVDSIEKNSLVVFNEKLDSSLGKRFKFLRKALIDFLKKIGCWDVVFDTLCSNWNCPFLPESSDLVSERDFSLLRNEIERRTTKAVSDYSLKMQKPSLDDIHFKGDFLEFSKAPLVNIVIRHIITHSITPDKLSANRMGFYMSVMKEIVATLKIIIGEDRWAGSKEQIYANSLYAFINDPSIPFSLNSIDNLELQSIAAFILRGHSYKDCISYIRMYEMEDYRYVLSLWGCLYGYMEMSKDILSKVLSIDNYSLIYRKMFGVEMAKISPSDNKKSDTKTDIIEFDIAEFKYILDILKLKKADLLIETLIVAQKNAKNSMEELLDVILKNKQFKRATKECEKARTALNIYLNRNNREQLEKVLSCSGLSSKVQKDILIHYGFVSLKQKKSVRARNISPNQLTLWDNGPQSLGPTLGYLPKLDCFKGLSDEIMNRLESNWHFTREKHPDNLREQITHFINLCKKEGSKGNKNGPTVLTSVFTHELANKAELELINYYGI